MSYSIAMQQPSTLTWPPFIVATLGRKDVGFAQTASNAKRFYLDRISDSLKLTSPLIIPYTVEGGYYMAMRKIGELVISSAEETYDDMVSDFKYQVSDAWDYYAQEKDEKLTLSARAVKEWLLKNISEEK